MMTNLSEHNNIPKRVGYEIPIIKGTSMTSILIIEIDPSLRFVIKESFRILLPESQIIVVENVQDAADAMDRYSPDVIILDGNLPVEACQEIALAFNLRKSVLKESRFFCIADTQGKLELLPELHICDGWLFKPFGLPALERVLVNAGVI